SQYVAPWTMKDGTAVLIRPIRPEDEPLIAAYHTTLSEGSVYLRYFNAMKLSHRVAHERLTRICFIDYDREMALVVERADPVAGRSILAVGRLSRVRGMADAEYAMLVSDAAQGKGLGTELLARLLRIARDLGLRRVFA